MTGAAQPPRVMMIIANFHPTKGGAENQAFLLSKELVKRGAQVSVLTLRLKNLPAEETIEGVRILRKIAPIPFGPLWGITYARDVRKNLISYQNDYDIIHCHQLYIHAAVGVRVAREFSKKVICKVVCGGEWSDFLRLERIRGGRAYLRDAIQLDRVVALNRDIQNEALAHQVPAERIAVIPNMVDTDRFTVTAQPRSENELVFIGRLHEQKNIPVLIEAFKILLVSRPSLRLRLLGDGPDRRRCETLIRDRGLGDRIALDGFQNDVRPALQSCACLVSASRAEGMSNALLEAMACGAPIVATNAQGNAEMLEAGAPNDEGFAIGRCGIVVHAAGPEPFARALAYALDRPELRRSFSESARATALAKYAIPRVIDRYLELYGELEISRA
jgi:glycosyltransferase involved in cell wall biosynthesis